MAALSPVPAIQGAWDPELCALGPLTLFGVNSRATTVEGQEAAGKTGLAFGSVAHRPMLNHHCFWIVRFTPPKSVVKAVVSGGGITHKRDNRSVKNDSLIRDLSIGLCATSLDGQNRAPWLKAGVDAVAGKLTRLGGVHMGRPNSDFTQNSIGFPVGEGAAAVHDNSGQTYITHAWQHPKDPVRANMYLGMYVFLDPSDDAKNRVGSFTPYKGARYTGQYQCNVIRCDFGPGFGALARVGADIRFAVEVPPGWSAELVSAAAMSQPAFLALGLQAFTAEGLEQAIREAAAEGKAWWDESYGDEFWNGSCGAMRQWLLSVGAATPAAAAAAAGAAAQPPAPPNASNASAAADAAAKGKGEVEKWLTEANANFIAYVPALCDYGGEVCCRPQGGHSSNARTSRHCSLNRPRRLFVDAPPLPRCVCACARLQDSTT